MGFGRRTPIENYESCFVIGFVQEIEGANGNCTNQVALLGQLMRPLSKSEKV